MRISSCLDSRWFIALAVALVGGLTFGLGSLTAKAQDSLAIKGGRILPVVGEPIEDGVILVRDGKIQNVGKDLDIPVGARVIDASGKVIVPGFVESHTSGGLSQTNEVNPNVPFVSVLDGIDPVQSFFEESRRHGTTSTAIVPGNNTMIGGQGAVIKTAGSYVEEMVLKRNAGLKLSLRPASGRSRMSHLSRLRTELVETQQYIEELEAKEKAKEEAEEAKPAEELKDSDDTPEDAQADDPEGEASDDDDEASSESPATADLDIQREAMVRLLRGDLPAFFYCDSAMDVPQALRLIEEFQLKAILILGSSCYKAMDLIAERGEPVILDPDLVFWETDPRTGEDKRIVLPKLYKEAGVPFTFQTNQSFSTVGSGYLWYQAATAVKYGLSEAEALEALTILPARLLGVEDAVGSIEPGKDADLLILTGDPLKLDTWVDVTIVDGQVVYERDKDQKIQDLLRPNEAEDR